MINRDLLLKTMYLSKFLQPYDPTRVDNALILLAAEFGTESGDLLAMEWEYPVLHEMEWVSTGEELALAMGASIDAMDMVLWTFGAEGVDIDSTDEGYIVTATIPGFYHYVNVPSIKVGFEND